MNETNSNNLSLAKKILGAIKSNSTNVDGAKEMLIAGAGGVVTAIPKVMTSMAELIKAEVESQNLQTEAFYGTYNKIMELCSSQMKKESVSDKDMDRYFQLLIQITNYINEDKKRNDEHHFRMKERLLEGLMAAGALIAAIFAFRNGDGNK